jgi:hypothetical protein
VKKGDEVIIENIRKSTVTTPKSALSIMPGAYDTFDYAEAHQRKLDEKKVTIAVKRQVGANVTLVMR